MYRVRGARRDAGPAVDAAVRVHVELGRCLEGSLVLLGMDAVSRARIDAEKIFDTGIGNYIGHDKSLRV